MKTTVMALTVLMILSAQIRADDVPEWVRKSFHADDGEYAYVVGVGVENDELTAIQQARRHALTTLIQAHFVNQSDAAVKTVQGVGAVYVDDEVASGTVSLNLSRFEQLDQYVEIQDGRFTAKSLFRFPKRIIEEAWADPAVNRRGTATVVAELDRKLSEARREQDQREKERIEREAVYLSTYPRLGLDMTIGYLKISKYSLFNVDFGIPIQVSVLSQRLYVRPFAGVGFGDSNTVAHEQSNSTTSPDYTTARTLGVDVRLFLTQTVERGFYLIGQAADDRVTPTCPKTNTGRCVGAGDPILEQRSFSGGVGYTFPAKYPLALEFMYGAPDSRIGVQVQMGIPLLK